MKKYEFTGETGKFRGRILHQIRAVRDFNNIKAGALGGWLESEKNLSHDGNCWVFPDAFVAENALVDDDAQVAENTVILGNAHIYQKAKVYLSSWVEGNAQVHGNASVCLMSHIAGNAEISDNAEVCYANWIDGQTKIGGTAHVIGAVRMEANAFIQRSADFFIAGGLNDYGNSATFYLCKDNRIRVSMAGKFFPSLDEFLAYADAAYGDSFHTRVCHLAAQAAKTQIVGAYLAARKKKGTAS